MKFTEAEAAWLRAALDGKTVEYRKKTNSYGWTTATAFFEDVIHLSHPDYEVRIKPDVIIVNGIEVPAPEKLAPLEGKKYFFPGPGSERDCIASFWDGVPCDIRRLEQGLVHVCEENAIAHAKAMRAHKPG